MNNNITGYDPNTGQPIYSNMPQNQNPNFYNQPAKKNNNKIVKILAIIGGIFIGIIVIIVVIFSLVSATSNKLICESNEGSITIMYNDKTIKGYTSNGIRYDMDQQKTIADQIGINSYISQFTTWFETNTTGTCTAKEK